MKRRAAARLHEQLAGLKIEQKIEFWRQRSEALAAEQARLRHRASPSPER